MKLPKLVLIIHFYITNYPQIRWVKTKLILSVWGQEFGSSVPEWLWLRPEVSQAVASAGFPRGLRALLLSSRTHVLLQENLIPLRLWVGGLSSMMWRLSMMWSCSFRVRDSGHQAARRRNIKEFGDIL